MQRSTLLLVAITALGACNTAQSGPTAATLQDPPPASTSAALEPPGTAAAPVAASASTSASPATTPDATSASPPDPGRVDLVFTGDFAQHVTGEAGLCGDDFWLRSTDVVGPDTKPRWVLLTADGGLQLQVGPFATARVFDSPRSGQGIERVGRGFQLDADLVEGGGKPGRVHVEGKIRCGRPASGAVPRAIADILGAASGKTVRPGCTQDFGREAGSPCVSVVVAGKPEGEARRLVSRVRQDLPAGWVAFVGTSRWLGDEQHDGAVEVVVGPGRDQFDIVRMARSNAINHEMETEALVKKLRAYHAIVPIDIWHAETDTIQLDLARTPPDLQAFAKDVYAFCPDIVDQGLGSVGELEKELARSRRLFLWWD